MNQSPTNNSNWLMDKFLIVLQFLGRTLYEPFLSAFKGETHIIWKFIVTFMLFLICILGIDGKILFYYNKGNIYDHKFYGFLQFLIALSPILIYGIFQSSLRTAFILNLKKIFDRSGLQNALKEYPHFISLELKENGSLKLRLTNNGLGINEWKNKKDRLEANLQVYIDSLEMVQDKGLVEITFSSTPMPQHLAYDFFEQYFGYKFLVGRNRTDHFEIDFTKDPHLLVAGETGGGKSYFIRQMIATIKANHPETVVKLFDLKKMGDFNCFSNIERIELMLGAEQAPSILSGVVTEIESRANYLRNSGFEDIGAYHRSRNFGEKSKAEKLKDPCGHRIFVVVDEFAELVLSGATLNTEEIKATREALSKISRLGRSCGIHLILTTQRPDRFVVDAQIKSNLISTVCFRINDIGGSLAVLGTKAACELPQIKGRALFKKGADEHEVQTPYLTDEGVRKLMQPFTKEEIKNGPSLAL